MYLEDSFELLPEDTFIEGDKVEIRNGDERQHGVVKEDVGRGFYDCYFGSKFDDERKDLPKKGIFSKFSLKLKI